MKTKIEWADYTWNPVWGCLAGCRYCYAKNIAKRFAATIAEKNAIFDWETGEDYATPNGRHVEKNQQEIEQNLKEFKPTFLGNNFESLTLKLYTKKGKPKKTIKRIFVGSMSDIAFWRHEWLQKVADEIKKHPNHTFLLLTKFPKIYKKLEVMMPDNVWFGVSVTQNAELKKIHDLYLSSGTKRKRFVSFEPLLERIDYFNMHTLHWIIIGTMSGQKRTPAKIEWIEDLVKRAKQYYIPVFVKQIEMDGKIIKDIEQFPEELQHREFPKPEFINHLKQKK